MSDIKLLSNAIRFALFAGAVSLVSAPVYAQDDDDDDDDRTTLETVNVTGSRISRADIEGSLPVVVISREELDNSGEISVADFLRNTTFNSFGSFRPQSGSSGQSNALLSLRGLGSTRTLILIDGHRAPVSPSLGGGQDLNSIPLAAVERIEILSDGASAIYGSDAIGGVVNIITRKDYNGVEARFGLSRPSQDGGDTEEASLIFGAASDRGSLLGGMSYNTRDIVFQRDREFSRGGVSTFGNNYRGARQVSGPPGSSNPADFRATGFLGGVNNFAPGGRGCTFPGAFTSSGFCFYDFTALAADEAAIDNSALFVRGEYQISDEWSTYMSGTVSRVESFGRYAPTPVQIFVPTSSPNNFVGAPVFLRHRLVAAGPRDTLIDSNLYDILWGFRGSLGIFDVDFGARHNEFSYNEFGRNYIVATLFEAAVASGRYNILDPLGNSPDVINGFKATINRDAFFIIEEVFGTASVDLWEMGGGAAAVAFGGEFRSEEYEDRYDSLSEGGVIAGSAGNSAAGDRDVRAVYAELLLPFTDIFEINLAGRYDEYSDYGSDFSPKISMRFQPFESLTFRGSYGEGFRAPTLDILNAATAFSADGVNDPATCIAFGQAPDCQTQIDAFVIANPNLSSEQSKQFSVGLAWQPLDWLDLTLDYYDIEIENLIAGIGTGTIIACLNGQIPCPPGVSNIPITAIPGDATNGLGVSRLPNGQILFVQRGFANRGTLETSGADLNIRTNFAFDAGNLRNHLAVSYVDNFSFDGGENQAGSFGAPEYRASLYNSWQMGDFEFNYNVNHIGPSLSFTDFPDDLPSYTTHDVQINWNVPWNATVTVGANNVTDKGPNLDPFDSSGRGYDQSLFDAYGRTPYIRYTQRF